MKRFAILCLAAASLAACDTVGDWFEGDKQLPVAQGERIFVFARQDLDFSALYDDPVSEALKEIRHERGLN